jgi:hypothetical protein
MLKPSQGFCLRPTDRDSDRSEGVVSIPWAVRGYACVRACVRAGVVATRGGARDMKRRSKKIGRQVCCCIPGFLRSLLFAALE